MASSRIGLGCIPTAKRCWRPFSLLYFVVLFVVLLLSCGRLLWLHVLFPVANAPIIEEPPSKPVEWPSAQPRYVDTCGFQQTSRFAIVSVMYNSNESGDVYHQYATTLSKSIRRYVKTDMILLVPLHERMGPALPFWRPCPVQIALHPSETARLVPAKRGGYNKLVAWNLTQYEAVLLIDLDTLVVGNIAPLFEQWPSILRSSGHNFAAAMDQPYKWSFRWMSSAGDRFNAGVFVLLPDNQIFRWLEDGLQRIQYAPEMMEQSYLNVAFRKQHYVLPPTYNAMVATAYTEPYAWNAFVEVGIKIIHFTFIKPQRTDLCEAAYVQHICALWQSL